MNQSHIGSADAGQANKSYGGIPCPTLLEHVPLAMVIVRDGRALYANPKFRSLFRLAADWDFQNTNLDSLFDAGTHAETTARRADGSSFVAKVETTEVDLPDGAARIVFLTDLTDQRRVESAAHEIESRLEGYLNLPLIGMGVGSPSNGRLIEVNQTLCNLLGYTRDELLSLDWLSLTHPDDRAADLAEFIRLVSGEIDEYSRTKRFIRKDGRVLDGVLAIRAVRDERGALAYCCGTLQDVTAQRNAESRARFIRRLYVMLAEINECIARQLELPVLWGRVCEVAVEHGFRMAWIGMLDESNERVLPVAFAGHDDGYLDAIDIDLRNEPRRQGLIGRSLLTGDRVIVSDVASDPIMEPWRKPALARGYRSCAAFPLRVDGKVIGVFALYRSESGDLDNEELSLLDQLALDVGHGIEVSRRAAERRAADQARAESEERFRQIAENIDQVFWVFDPVVGRTTYVSPVYERIWGRTCESALAVTAGWVDAVHPDDRERVAAAAGQQPNGKPYDETYRILRPDGSVRWIRDRGFPIRDANGVVSRVVGTASDITEQRSLQEQLLQAQKMEAVGQLAGGVAHDFNNLLSVILMEAELAASMERVPSDVVNMLDEVKDAATRAASLTRQLLAFSRRQVIQLRLLDVNDSVASLTKMLQRVLGEDITVQMRLHRSPLFARADAGMLDQVLMNLAVNARDAMPNGGALEISTAPVVVTPETAILYGSVAPGNYVSLSVHDSGAGIPDDVLCHVFEPFFTTKEAGKGTGLGLATVFGIAQQHHGAVVANSEPGSGATFCVLLPAACAEDGVPDEASARIVRGGSETVLLVEDEDLVRRLARVALVRQGYRVLEASNGREALRRWEQHDGAIQLLVTDIVMPGGISGHHLAEQLNTRDPNLRVVFTTGYSGRDDGRELTVGDGRTLLQKPYLAEQLLQTVRFCLDG